MNRAFPVIVAVLLIFCSPAAAFGTGMSTVVAKTPSAKNPVQPPGFNNTAYQLSIGTPDRSGTDTPSLSLSTALEMDRNDLETQKRMNTLDERLSNVKSSGEKKQILSWFKANISVRLSALQTEERTTSQRFNSQAIGTDEYINDLAMIEVKANNIEDAVKRMKSAAKRENVVRFQPYEWQYLTKLIPLRSKIREAAVESFHYGTSSEKIYVATTSNGVALSSIISNQYIRDVYRSDYRNTSLINQMTSREANNITIHEYPWSTNNKNKISSPTKFVYDKAAQTKIIYPQGVIEAYLDTGTKKIYREIQYKSLTGDNHAPYGASVENNSTNLHLVVNRTYSGGPLRINLTDSEGDPVNGHIEIGETELGDTGPTGTIYTISPSREFTVTATHDSETVKVTLTPYGVTNRSSNGETPRNAGESP